MKKVLLLVIMTIALTGCFGGFTPDILVKHPDASFLIREYKVGGLLHNTIYVRVALYSPVRKKLVDYGWIEIDDRYEGWTLSKVDWNKASSD
jgi:uncharacterized membrane protein YeiH